MANDQGTFHADLCELLTILGMGDHSRPQSPHEVFQEALGVLRERLSLPAPTPTPPYLGEREAVARTLSEIVRVARDVFNFDNLERDILEAIEPLRTENETLRAERDAAIARAEEA